MEELFSKRPTPGKIMLQMPAEIRFVAAPQDWEITRRIGAGESVVFSWWDVGQSTEMRIADSFALRDAFFAVKNPDDAEVFLARCGPFASDRFEVSWSSFLGWKEYFTRQRVLPKGWGSPPERCREPSLSRIMGEPSLRTWPILRRGGKTQVTLLLDCDSALEAIAAANYLDRRLGNIPKTCGGCGDVFQPATKRAKTCSKRCTHLLGQRRRRAKKEDSYGEA